MFISSSAPFSAPPYNLVPSRKPVEDWIEAIRVFIRDTLGNKNWQIRESKGKVRLGIRFDDGTRRYWNVPYKWQRVNAKAIQKFIEEVHHLHITKGVPIEEAVERTKAQAPKDKLPKAKTSEKKILDAWKKYQFYKVTQTGDVSEKTWRKEYGMMILNEKNGKEEAKGKTFSQLVKVADSQDANSLLINIGKFSDAGGRMREQTIQHIRSFLEWAISKESGYLLDVEVFEPPAKANLKKYKGKKSKEAEAKSKDPTYPIEDDEINELIDYLDNPPEEKTDVWKARASEWSLAIKLIATYGLRPIEVKHLSVRKNGAEYLWCSYVKKSGSGTTDPRRLRPLHPEWEKNWNLIKKIKNNSPLPNMKQGAGEALKNYLRFNPIWKRMKEDEKKNIVGYSFRHAYAKRAHSEYLVPPNELIEWMGHEIESHAKYGIYYDDQQLDDAYQRALARRKQFKK